MLIKLSYYYFFSLFAVLVAPDLISSSPSSDIIVIEWNPVDHTVLYSLVMTMEGSDTQVRLNTTETNVTFTDLQPGTTYSIKGNAWDPDGNQGDDITVYQITRKGSLVSSTLNRMCSHNAFPSKPLGSFN